MTQMFPILAPHVGDQGIREDIKVMSKYMLTITHTHDFFFFLTLKPKYKHNLSLFTSLKEFSEVSFDGGLLIFS